jgi:adenosylmethionine-8-amino-7-oxononanoate aminotransferase
MSRKRTEELLKWDREHIVHSRYGIGGNIGIITDKGHGIYFQDTDGKDYIDCASQLLCVNLGYGQKEIVDAAYKEMKRLQYSTLFHGFSNVASIKCGRKLSELVPEGLDHFNFTSGGSEGIGVAIRLAQLYWRSKNRANKAKIISLYDSYHGTGHGGLTATGSGRGFYEKDAGPLAGGFVHIPSYYCYRCMFGLSYGTCNIQCARFLAEVIEKEGAESVAAFIAEPELGVGDMIAPPPEYWPLIRSICTKYEVLLITDEVMTGFGRTGKMFAVEHWGIKPDIMVMAKGLTSAYLPFGAVAFNDDIWKELEGKNLVSYTYAGHPTCAAVAVKTMEIYVRDKVVENAASVGGYALNRLKQDFEPLACVGEVGGLGLMLGIEIVADKGTKATFAPDLHVMQQLQEKALEKGMFIRTAEITSGPGDKICFAPPLIITKEEVDKALDILHRILSDLKPK